VSLLEPLKDVLENDVLVLLPALQCPQKLRGIITATVFLLTKQEHVITGTKFVQTLLESRLQESVISGMHTRQFGSILDIIAASVHHVRRRKVESVTVVRVFLLHHLSVQDGDQNSCISESSGCFFLLHLYDTKWPFCADVPLRNYALTSGGF